MDRLERARATLASQLGIGWQVNTVGYCGHTKLLDQPGARAWIRELVLSGLYQFRPKRVLVVGRQDLVKVVGEVARMKGVAVSSIMSTGSWGGTRKKASDREAYEMLIEESDVFVRMSLPRPERKLSLWAWSVAMDDLDTACVIDCAYPGPRSNFEESFIMPGGDC